MCYSDLPYLYTGRGLVELNWPYSDDAQVRARYEVMEYPVGIAYFAYGAAWVTQRVDRRRDVHARADQPAGDLVGTAQVQKEMRAFVIVNALGLRGAGAAVGVAAGRGQSAATVGRGRLRRSRRRWCSPASSTGTCSRWSSSRARCSPGRAAGRCSTGVLIGLGTATKLYPLFLLGPIAIICLRERRYRDLVDTVLAAAASWFVLNVPAYLSGTDEWKVFWEFNSERGPDLGSVWLVLSQGDATTRSPRPRSTTGPGRSSALWCAAVAVLGLPRAEHAAAGAARLPRRRRLPAGQQGLLAAVRALAAAARRAGPAALARPADLAGVRGPLLRVGVVVPRRRPRSPAGGEDVGFYWVAILIRMVGELYLRARCVVRATSWLPAHDPVRRADRAHRRTADRQLTSTRSNVVAV